MLADPISQHRPNSSLPLGLWGIGAQYCAVDNDDTSLPPWICWLCHDHPEHVGGLRPNRVATKPAIAGRTYLGGRQSIDNPGQITPRHNVTTALDIGTAVGFRPAPAIARHDHHRHLPARPDLPSNIRSTPRRSKSTRRIFATGHRGGRQYVGTGCH